MSLETFFNPKSVAVVGVSENPDKLGSIVFKNLLEGNYAGELIAVNPKSAGQKLMGKDCIAKVSDHTEPFDLVVVVVPSKFTEGTIDECVANHCKNVIIITAGFGEIGNHKLEDDIKAKCKNAGIRLLGPNCLGAISTYNNMNASFAQNFPLKGKVAFISQSGAFCCAMLDWANERNIGFSYFVSIGNKADISECDLLEAIKDDSNVELAVFYLESLKEGQRFLKLIREVSQKKPVVILQPGKSQKAAAASLSHTGSLAPNALVLEKAYAEAGAIQVFSMNELFSVIELIERTDIHKAEDGLVILTNAGGAGVLTSDLVEENQIETIDLSQNIHDELSKLLPEEASLKNPVDVIGDARADRYKIALEKICEDPKARQVLVLLTPQRTTEPKETAEVIVEVVKKTDRNIVACFSGGSMVKPGRDILKANQVVHFDYPVDAVRAMGLLNRYNKKRKQLAAEKANNISVGTPKAEIVQAVEKAQQAGLKSLPQETVNLIMDTYGIDYPKCGNFTDEKAGLAFAEKFFPRPVVLKISSPDALHKTELKGIVLNVNSAEKFADGWRELQHSIQQANLRDAEILIQEQISNAKEVIVGVNTDANFGRVMVFGTGGIYTEVYKDTTLRVLPDNNLARMLDETKMGTILQGVRGEKPMAVEAMVDALQRIQKLVLELPQIKSIDVNPVLVTADRAVCVDFKMIL